MLGDNLSVWQQIFMTIMFQYVQVTRIEYKKQWWYVLIEKLLIHYYRSLRINTLNGLKRRKHRMVFL